MARALFKGNVIRKCIFVVNKTMIFDKTRSRTTLRTCVEHNQVGQRQGGQVDGSGGLPGITAREHNDGQDVADGADGEEERRHYLPQ